MTQIGRRARVPLVIGVILALAASCDSNLDGGSSHAAHAAQAMTTLASNTAAVPLGDMPLRVALAPKGAPSTLAAGGRIELVLSGLGAARQPGIVYRVYFGLPDGAAPDEAHFVATINFFNVVPLAGARPKPDQPLRFDVTALASPLLADRSRAAQIAVTLVPQGKTESGSQPQIKSIALIEP